MTWVAQLCTIPVDDFQHRYLPFLHFILFATHLIFVLRGRAADDNQVCKARIAFGAETEFVDQWARKRLGVSSDVSELIATPEQIRHEASAADGKSRLDEQSVTRFWPA